MCYGFPCMFWKGDTETCSKPLWEDCPEKRAQDMSTDDDEIFSDEHVMAFLRGLLEEAEQERHQLNAGN